MLADVIGGILAEIFQSRNERVVDFNYVTAPAANTGDGPPKIRINSGPVGNLLYNRGLMDRPWGNAKTEMGFDRSAAADLWRHTLSQIPTTFGRLVFLASLRDPNTGIYEHYGFAQRVGETVAEEALNSSHRQCFSEWLDFTLEQQSADLDLYLSSIQADKKTILETWVRTKPYRNLIPARALEVERELYNSDLEKLIENLRTVHGVAFPDPDA